MAGIHAVYTLEEPDSAAAQSPQCAHEFKLTTAAVSDVTNRPIIGRSLSVTVAAAAAAAAEPCVAASKVSSRARRQGPRRPARTNHLSACTGLHEFHCQLVSELLTDSDSHSRTASEGGVRDTAATSGFADASASAEPEQSKRNPHG